MTVARYYDLETRKLTSDAELVPLFTSHPGTVGAFREARLRTYLRQHIGARHELASGSVVDHDPGSDMIGDRSSRQIDCLIHDPTERAPLIATDTFAAVLPPQVGGLVEVKSSLGIGRRYAGRGTKGEHPHADARGRYRWSGTLVDALENVLSGIRVMRDAGIDRARYFAGVFAYDGDDLNLLATALASGELIGQLGVRDIDDLPDSVCVLTRGWWGFSAYPWNDIDSEWDDVYDPAGSYLLAVSASGEAGAPLQLFTSFMTHALEGWADLDRRTGGLRSLAGRNPVVENTKLSLPCPGKGPAS